MSELDWIRVRLARPRWNGSSIQSYLVPRCSLWPAYPPPHRLIAVGRAAVFAELLPPGGGVWLANLFFLGLTLRLEVRTVFARTSV